MFWGRREGKGRDEVSFKETFKRLIGKIENSRGNMGLPSFSAENTGLKEQNLNLSHLKWSITEFISSPFLVFFCKAFIYLFLEGGGE